MEQTSPNINNLVDHLFRHEAGKMVAVLSRLLGLQHLERVQDIVQDTLLQAMNSWSFNNIPQNPTAWLYKVAKNKAIDFLRKERRWRNYWSGICAPTAIGMDTVNHGQYGIPGKRSPGQPVENDVCLLPPCNT